MKIQSPPLKKEICLGIDVESFFNNPEVKENNWQYDVNMLIARLNPIFTQESSPHALKVAYLSLKVDGKTLEIPLFQPLYINFIQSTLSFLWAGYFERWIDFFEITIYPKDNSSTSNPRFHQYSNTPRVINVFFDNILKQTTLALGTSTLWCPKCEGVLSAEVLDSDSQTFSRYCFHCEYRMIEQ